MTGDSREHPLFTICAQTTGAESHREKERDVVDGALAYSNLLRTRSSARRTMDARNGTRDHLRRVFCPRADLAAGSGSTLYRLVFTSDRFKQRKMMLDDRHEHVF